jgi:hypothetical protein
MTPENARAFDQAVGDLVRQYDPHTVHQQVSAQITWGLPHGAPTTL